MNAYTKQKNHRRNRPAMSPELRVALLLIGAIVLVLGAVYVVGSLNRTQQAQANLAQVVEGVVPEDVATSSVATEAPIQAVHEMGAGPRIPFLPKDGPQPAISLSEATYDFGQIGPTDIVERTFFIRNNGDAPLTISRAYTTCGCTTADISASVIPPGKVATVNLIFDAGFHDTAGQTVRRGLIIESNDPGLSQAEFWVEADVLSN